MYEPAEDSFLLQGAILAEKLRGKKCLDMGTGSGLQARAMYDAGARDIFCVDINYKALLKSQQKNVDIKQHLHFIESNLFDKLRDQKFDFIAFNPPYVPSDKVKWKDLDGGKDGRVTIDLFLSQFVGHLAGKGIVLLLVSSLNKEKEIISKMKMQGLFCEIVASKKLFFEELFVLRISKKPNIGLDYVDFKN